MKLIDYWNSLSETEKAEFAEEVGASVMTIKQKYMCPPHSREVPRRERMQKMISKAGHKVSRNEFLEHFYPPEQGTAA